MAGFEFGFFARWHMNDLLLSGRPEIGHGLSAGVLATVVQSILMMTKHAIGLMPQRDPIHMIAKRVGASTPSVGWITDFVIGLIWGVAFDEARATGRKPA
ncbi:MAG: hypothetical protein EPN57_00650 [Paraburkholderia sp.]|nr:MAG: hypothetical protein EPN57_00650 [Paraburkholderia sp.]